MALFSHSKPAGVVVNKRAVLTDEPTRKEERILAKQQKQVNAEYAKRAKQTYKLGGSLKRFKIPSFNLTLPKFVLPKFKKKEFSLKAIFPVKFDELSAMDSILAEQKEKIAQENSERNFNAYLDLWESSENGL